MHLILLVVALVSFAFSAWQSSSPYWNRFVSIGLSALVASMISW